MFLGALQKIGGVRITYDRRVYDKGGKVKGKTTFYRLLPAALDAALPGFELAA